jgi:hypothetical protein
MAVASADDGKVEQTGMCRGGAPLARSTIVMAE